MQKYLIAITLLLPITTNAAWNVEARSDFENWSSGFGESSNNLIGGGAVQFSQNRFFASAGLNTSLIKYKVDAPESSLARREIDLSGGYQLAPHWSAFAGYRVFRLEFASRDPARTFTDNIQGFGAGVTYSSTIASNIVGFASANISGVYSAVTYSDNIDRGVGYAIGSEFGIGYRLTQAMFVAASTKFQTMNIDYGADQWTNQYSRIGARLSYRF